MFATQSRRRRMFYEISSFLNEPEGLYAMLEPLMEPRVLGPAGPSILTRCDEASELKNTD